MSRVSFVTTVHNKAAALPFLVAGLAAQEGDFAREFMFVDDGSTDGSADLLRELTRGWLDVTIVQQPNSGPAAALNSGLRRVRGDYIKPMDGDDLLLPWATRHLLEAIDATGCNVAFAPQTLVYDLTASPEDMLAACRRSSTRVERCDDMLRRSLRRAQTNPSAWLARAEIVRRSGGCDERVFIQDYSIELRMALLGSFARVGEPVFMAPVALPGRLSGNQAQILHDLNLALANLIADRPDLPLDLARLGFARAATRAWMWGRRHGGRTPASREFRLFCGARLNLLRPSPANLRATCAVFVETASIRAPPSLTV
jgi:glycosyltransferase involved in cell wall biosynthesis